MKEGFKIGALLLIVFMLIPLSGCSSTVDGVKYEKKNDHAIVTGCDKNSDTLEIKPEYDGVPVTQIAHEAFKGSKAEKITLPGSVELIEYSAFTECPELKTVSLPEGLKKIDDNAFKKCTALEEIVIPDSVESIGRYAFADCTSLNKITLPESLKSLDCFLFEGCTALEELNIPGGTEKFLGSSFNNCTSLKRIYIGEGMTQNRDLEDDLKAIGDTLEEVHYPKSYVPADFCGKTSFLSNPESVKNDVEKGASYKLEEGYSLVTAKLADALAEGTVRWEGDDRRNYFGSVKGSGRIVNISGGDVLIELSEGDLVPDDGNGQSFTVTETKKIFLDAQIDHDSCTVEYSEPYYFDSEYSSETSSLRLKVDGESRYYRLVRTDGKTELEVLPDKELPAESRKFTFPAGTYELKIATGDNWLGKDKLFGEEGTYTTTGLFSFKAGESYEITLSDVGNIKIDDDPM